MVDLDEDVVAAIRPDLPNEKEEVLNAVLAAKTIGELERIEDGLAYVLLLGDYPEPTIAVDTDRFDELKLRSYYWVEIADDEGFRPDIDRIEYDSTLNAVMRAYNAEEDRRLEAEYGSDADEANGEKEGLDDVGLDDLR